MSNEVKPVAVQTQPAAAVTVKPEAAPAVKPSDAKPSGEQTSVASATPAPEQGKKLDKIA